MRFCKRFFLVVFACGIATAQNYDSAQQITDNLLKSFVDATSTPSISVSIAIDDDIIYSNTFGYSDINNKIKSSIETKYRIGSITKLFTAVALTALIEKNFLKESDYVSSYIKNFPESYQDITVAQLAGHLAGIRHYTREEIFSQNTIEYSDLEDALYKFVSDTLISNPGDKYNYSSYGYVLLGALMENATGKNFTDIIFEYVLSPAEMNNTTPEFYTDSISGKSLFYYKSKDGGFVFAEGQNYSYKWPAGGYLSTASDLVKFGSALLSGKLVSKDFLPLLFTPQKTNDGKVTNCGFGFRIGTDQRDRKVVFHGGESEGGRAFLLIYPESKFVIAMMANVFRAPLYEGEAETIAGYFLSDYDKMENKPSGIIDFSTIIDDKSVDGKINFDEENISGINDKDLSILDIVIDGDSIKLITISQTGIINFWLTKTNGHFSGKWGYDKAITELKF